MQLNPNPNPNPNYKSMKNWTMGNERLTIIIVFITFGNSEGIDATCFSLLIIIIWDPKALLNIRFETNQCGEKTLKLFRLTKKKRVYLNLNVCSTRTHIHTHTQTQAHTRTHTHSVSICTSFADPLRRLMMNTEIK